MEDVSNYVPIKHLRTHGGVLGKAFGDLVDLTYKDGFFDPKTRELLYIAVHSAIHNPTGIVRHLARARASGCSKTDVINAILIAGINAGITGAVMSLPPVLEEMQRMNWSE